MDSPRNNTSARALQREATAWVALDLGVSKEEQRERQSIDTQREFGTKYSDLHQFPVYGILAADGVTGTIPLEKRPEGQRILEAARRGEFNQLLIYKLDRIGRDSRLILNAAAELEKYGVRGPVHDPERSIAATERLVGAGAWIGGIVRSAIGRKGRTGGASRHLTSCHLRGGDPGFGPLGGGSHLQGVPAGRRRRTRVLLSDRRLH